MRIGIIGGTGREGRGLAARWARAGHHVTLGSRDVERARAVARELATGGNGSGATALNIQGGDNAWAISAAEVVLLSVPYAAHAETLGALRAQLHGKIVIDITVPLKPPKVTQVHLPAGQSAALEAQAILGPATPVAAGLHHVSSSHLGDPDMRIDCDVLVCSDDDRARAVTIELVGDLGLRGLDAGPLRNAIALEALTPVLLHLNKKYGVSATCPRFHNVRTDG